MKIKSILTLERKILLDYFLVCSRKRKFKQPKQVIISLLS